MAFFRRKGYCFGTKCYVKSRQKNKLIMKDKLKNIISEAVRDAMNEASLSQKKCDNFNVEKGISGGVSKGGIRTITVYTGENPNSTPAGSTYNKKANRNISDALKMSGYRFTRATGKFGNAENPFVVFNMPTMLAKKLCGRCEQTSFIVTKFGNGESAESEYWEKEDTKRPYDGVRNDYVLKDTCDSYTDRTGADDYYTILGNNFKFSIPFSIFESIDRRIAENAERLLRKGLYESKEQLYEWALERVGYKAAMTRRALNG